MRMRLSRLVYCLFLSCVRLQAARLTANGVKFTMSKSGRRALFCRDPYMNAIEFVEDKNIKVA
jgi:glyoxylase I family protein